MNNMHFYTQLPRTYRTKEMRQITSWFRLGESGSVLALPGCGKATFLSFLCHNHEALTQYLANDEKKIVVVPVDLNNLPDRQLATLYRVILRSLSEIKERFPAHLQDPINHQYRKHEASTDPFLPQSGLRELLFLFQKEKYRIVWVINRFDQFCAFATPDMISTLRGFRDLFKRTLIFIMGMKTEVAYLPNGESIEPLRHILDTHTCWITPLNLDDAAHMINEQSKLQDITFEEDTVQQIFALSGGYPSLIRVLCQRVDQIFSAFDQVDSLLKDDSLQHRLHLLWQALTQEEQQVILEISKIDQQDPQALSWEDLAGRHEDTLQRLAQKGMIISHQNRWIILADLMKGYIANLGGIRRGRLALNTETGELFLGPTSIGPLKPLEMSVLAYLFQNTHIRHTHTEIIEGGWPDDVIREGVSTEALYQVIRSLRKTIEPNPRKPVYIVTWRGQPEGGYLLFPEGKPQN